MASVESQPSSASNGGLFSSTSPERGYPYPGQEGVNAGLETQKQAEVKKLSTDITKTLCGFDSWRRAIGEGYIIDMYIYRPSELELEPIPEEEAEPKFIKQIRKIDEIGGAELQNLPPEWTLIRANLVAVLTYLDEENKYKRAKTGEKGIKKMDYSDYLQRVVGFEPRQIPLKVLEHNRDEMLELAREVGVRKFDSQSDRSVKDALRAHQQQVKITSKERFRSTFNDHLERHSESLGEILGEDVADVDVKLRFVNNEKLFWRMNEVILPEDEHFDVNMAERHSSYYNTGTIEMYSIHEPTHAQWAHKVRKQIQEGKIDKAAGLVVIPGPACWQLEGIAQTLAELASLDVRPMGQYAISTYSLEKRAQNNFLYEIEMNGMPIEDAVTQMGHFTPLFSRKERGTLLRDGTRKPWERAYLPIYGRSDDDFVKLREKLGHDAMINIFLPEWFNKIATRDQIMRPRDVDYEKYLWNTAQ